MQTIILLAILACVSDKDDTSGTTTQPVERAPFACGDLECSGDQYCEIIVPGMKPKPGSGDPQEYACVDAPTSCDTPPDCACLVSTDACPAAGGTCEESASVLSCTLYTP